MTARVAQPSPLVVTHRVAAAMLSMHPRDLKRAGDEGRIPYTIRGQARKRPRRLYLVEDIETFARAEREETRERCHRNAGVRPASPGSSAGRAGQAGTCKRPSGGRTGHVFSFAEALARTTSGSPKTS